MYRRRGSTRIFIQFLYFQGTIWLRRDSGGFHIFASEDSGIIELRIHDLLGTMNYSRLIVEEIRDYWE